MPCMPLPYKAFADHHPRSDDSIKNSSDAPPRVIAISNQKGGVGKTTTAINLATAIAACNFQILLIDLDAQSNTSTGLMVSPDARNQGIYPVLTGQISADQSIFQTQIPGLHMIPASVDLAAAELYLTGQEQREYRLAQSLEAILGHYDYILIDCPPALGLLTINALCLADSVLIPVQCEFYALEGLGRMASSIERIKAALNRKLELAGILLTMVDRRNKLSEQVERDVRDHFGTVVFETTIPRNVKLSEAPSHGMPALFYDPQCRGALAYMQLAAEFLQREGRLP
ncbi:MAG: ParA family protein [Pseudomonadota bacterium]